MEIYRASCNNLKPTNNMEDSNTKNSIQDTKKALVDISLFVNPVFMCFAASIFLLGLAFNTPYIFIVDQAIHSFNVEPENADILLSSIGILSTIGKIVVGYLGGLKKVNRIYLFSTILTICGIVTLIEPMAIFLFAR